MYKEIDFIEIKKQLNKMIILVAAIFFAFLIPSVAFMLRLPQWIGAVFLSVGVSLVIFIWGVYGTPTLNYYRYIKDIMEGRIRETKGIVANIAQEPVYKDNRLLYYEILINDLEDDVERVLLYDENKGKPNLEVGSKYLFRTFQNFITNIESL
ncbi:MAG TPA: hypothetical protein GX505_08335 [Clostridiales bacterium]|nr:hypothetical protein [Clostridiales bacterium]